VLVSGRRPSWFVALVVACASLGCAQKPTMHVNHAEISGLQFATVPPGIAMNVVIDVYNPNGYDVAVRAVRGQTIFADQFPLAVYFQAPPEGVWLPAGQTTPIRVPMTLPMPLAWTLVQQGFASPTIPYRFVGTADVTATRTFQLEKDNYSVDERGALTRADMLAVIPASLMPH
jgi:hypothetical protein